MFNLQEIQDAIKQIAQEKNISPEAILETIEAALAVAYRKDFGEKNQNIQVEFDADTGEMSVFDEKTVSDIKPLSEEELEKLKEEAEEKKQARIEARKAGEELVEEEEEEPRFNPKTDIYIDEAKERKPDAAVGDVLHEKLEVPDDFGRMAAQTAKQVVIQKIREAERETIYDAFKDKVGEMITGTVQRQEGPVVLVDLGKATGIIIPSEQIRREDYRPGARLKVYIVSVEKSPRGPEIILSRSHPDIVRNLMTTEVPEIQGGSIEITGIAREAGSRTKISVKSLDESIDPIGSCVGQRGTRIQTIINELDGEKIDCIEYDEDPITYIKNSLSPAKVVAIELNEEENEAKVIVKEDQLSLAIGKAGQNVRLAAKLTGWKIDIVKDGEDEEGDEEKSEEKDAEAPESEEEKPDVVEETPEEEKGEEKEEVAEEVADEEAEEGEKEESEEQEEVEEKEEESEEEVAEEKEEEEKKEEGDKALEDELLG